MCSRCIPGDDSPVSSVAVTGGGSQVYSSADRLYVWSSDAGLPFRHPLGSSSGTTVRPLGVPHTDVHAFAIDGDETRYVASGRVDGQARDSWSFDEHDGHLRIALTWPRRSLMRRLDDITPSAEPGGDNGIVVLDEQGDRLVPVGQLRGLGRNEQIQSVRWFDDLAVLVTFRQTDPLFTVDVTDPTQPRALGALHLPGFSSYLHPIGGDRLLGLGTTATAEGETQGTKAAVFDLADPAHVRQLAETGLGDGYLAAANDPHAFTWLPAGSGTGTAITQVEMTTGTVALEGDPGRSGRPADDQRAPVGWWVVPASPAARRRPGGAGGRSRGADDAVEPVPGPSYALGHVSQHQDSPQLRTSGHPRRGARRGRAVRPQDQRVDAAVAGQPGRLRPGRRRRRARHPAPARAPEHQRAAEEPRGGGRQGPGEGGDPLRARLTSSGGRTVVLTGAGLSTDSGIPDYRGPGAPVRAPMTFQEFVAAEQNQRRYWARAHLGWSRMGGAEPNAGHRALARLEALGEVSFLITQNVDGLHERAGHQAMVALHGRISEVVCLDCGADLHRTEMQRRLASANPGWLEAHAEVTARPDGDVDLEETDGFVVPGCSGCGGRLKPHVVFFGENVPPRARRAVLRRPRRGRQPARGGLVAHGDVGAALRPVRRQGRPARRHRQPWRDPRRRPRHRARSRRGAASG